MGASKLTTYCKAITNEYQDVDRSENSCRTWWKACTTLLPNWESGYCVGLVVVDWNNPVVTTWHGSGLMEDLVVCMKSAVSVTE